MTGIASIAVILISIDPLVILISRVLLMTGQTGEYGVIVWIRVAI